MGKIYFAVNSIENLGNLAGHLQLVYTDGNGEPGTDGNGSLQ